MVYTTQRTEQISKKQECFTVQDNTSWSCLTNREWHVVIRAGVFPLASEISHHLGELWKKAGRGLMNVVCGSVVRKKVWQTEQAKQTKRTVKTETEGSEREEAVWEMRGEAWLQHERGPSTHDGPHHSVCERLKDPCTSVKTKALQSFGLPPQNSCLHLTSPLMWPHQLSQRGVSMGKGAWSLLC